MFTEAQIRKMPGVDMTVTEAVAHFKRFGVRVSERKLWKLGNGAYLGVWKQEDGRMVRLHLKTIWIKPYSLSYRNTKTKNGKAREGREILISNFPLPKGPVVTDKKHETKKTRAKVSRSPRP